MSLTAGPVVWADARVRFTGAVPSGNRRVPSPRTSGNTMSRYSSTRSLAISVLTTLPLPMTMMSCVRLRSCTAAARSPCRTVEFFHSAVCSSDRDTTSLGTAFIWAENGSSRPGQILANISQVRRPSSIAPVSSTSPRPNGSLVTGSGPYRNAHPPCLNPSFPSGSWMTPSRDMNSMTMTRFITVLLEWFLPYRRAGTCVWGQPGYVFLGKTPDAVGTHEQQHRQNRDAVTPDEQ